MEIHLLSKKEISEIRLWNPQNLEDWIKWIYFLLDSSLNITYIWQSKNIKRRIIEHLKSSHMVFTYFSYIEIYWTKRDLADREWLYILKYWDQWVQNKKLDIAALFIRSIIWVRKASKILVCSCLKTRKVLLDVPQYMLWSNKYYLRTHLKNKIEELQTEWLCVAYGYEFEKL